MNQQVKKKWLKALRDGSYTQGAGAIAKTDSAAWESFAIYTPRRQEVAGRLKVMKKENGTAAIWARCLKQFRSGQA